MINFTREEMFLLNRSLDEAIIRQRAYIKQLKTAITEPPPT